MAKKNDVTIKACAMEKAQVPVRFEMLAEDYQRLERQARKLGLSKASYAKMCVMKGIGRTRKKEARGDAPLLSRTVTP